MTTVFLHIPKTAGTTLKTVLLRHYAPWRVHRFYPEGGHARLLRDLRHRLDAGQRIDLILGHLGFGIHEDIDREVRYLTVLREPVRRVLSLYRHVRRTPDHPLHGEVQGMSVYDFVNSGIDDSVANNQTRFLSGDKWNEEMGRARRPATELLSAALRNLDRIAVVGVSERLDETLLILRRTMDWRDVYYASLNIGHDGDPTSTVERRTVERIAELNQQDTALYNEVVRRFAERVHQEVEPAEVRAFRRRNRLVGPPIGYASRIFQRLTVGL